MFPMSFAPAEQCLSLRRGEADVLSFCACASFPKALALNLKKKGTVSILCHYDSAQRAITQVAQDAIGRRELMG